MSLRWTPRWCSWWRNCAHNPAPGERVSTLDLLGPGFTVLTGDQRWRAAVTSASATLGIPITMHCIGDDGWAAITGLAPEGALLVRPDDFIGWRADQLSANPEAELRQALSAILAR